MTTSDPYDYPTVRDMQALQARRRLRASRTGEACSGSAGNPVALTAMTWHTPSARARSICSACSTVKLGPEAATTMRRHPLSCGPGMRQRRGPAPPTVPGTHHGSCGTSSMPTTDMFSATCVSFSFLTSSSNALSPGAMQPL